jgi:hypothetical protein
MMKAWQGLKLIHCSDWTLQNIPLFFLRPNPYFIGQVEEMRQ